MGQTPTDALCFTNSYVTISVTHSIAKKATLRAWMAEWSKAVDSSSILSGGVGSNPTPSIYLFASA